MPDEALARLRVLAKERAWGRDVDPGTLIEAALAALLAGVDSPSLALLAGLGRNEKSQAGELFDQVLEELDLVFAWPTDPDEALWALARWRAKEVADGEVEPVEGAELIWKESAKQLGYPAELRPFVHRVVEWHEPEDTRRPREQIAAEIVRDARDFFTGESPARHHGEG